MFDMKMSFSQLSSIICISTILINSCQVDGKYDECRRYETVSGEGWERVRHIPQGNTWHPVNDNLMGTAEYGDPQDDSKPWSTPWSLLEVEEFLFTTGDKEKWIIVNKEELVGANGTKEYSKQKISVRASSRSCEAYQAVMYKRSYIDEDPYVSIFDHPGEVMYAEVSYPHHNHLVKTHGGMDVFIKTEMKKMKMKQPKKNNEIGTIDSWGPLFRVSLDLKLKSDQLVPWTSILAFKTNDGTRDYGKHGDRCPAMFLNKDGHIYFMSSVGSNANYQTRSKNIQLNKWMRIIIEQTKRNLKVYFTVSVDGQIVHEVENTNPRTFEDVKVFAGDNFYPAPDASYKNVHWENIESAGCPSGWSEFQGECYKYFNDRKQWQDARTQCLAEQADLASIHSDEENDFVASLARDWFWLGGKRSCDDCTDFTWTDGTPWDYDAWLPNQPDNWRGNEGCAVNRLGSDNQWNDAPCDTSATRFIVCKRPR